MIDIKDIKTNEQKIDDDSVEWDICCSKSSKAFIKYVSTVAISIIVLIFSIVMVALHPDRDNSIYYSLISSTVMIYVNPPSIDKTN